MSSFFIENQITALEIVEDFLKKAQADIDLIMENITLIKIQKSYHIDRSETFEIFKINIELLFCAHKIHSSFQFSISHKTIYCVDKIKVLSVYTHDVSSIY